MSIDNTGGFCSRLCKSLFSDDPTGNVSSIFRCSSEKSAKSLLLQGTVRPRGASLNVVDSLHLCLGESSCPQFGKPFIIWQFRKTNGQMFANSFLDESCSLRGLVWDSQFELDSLPSTLLLESLTDRITTKILFALNEEGFCDFHSWISCAHIVQAQGECEGKELSESALGLVSLHLSHFQPTKMQSLFISIPAQGRRQWGAKGAIVPPFSKDKEQNLQLTCVEQAP